ncbi:NAD(P)/FAD-dependent oxidoreductase [Brucepastera parasyntrophica]|uniref:NAD(P)/FAD-dependent oxidoreductase n=1 Tax=Brucepastera parasyntrophica TaxID=2880008 RepID=UPI00210A7B1B|nr:FAD-dependent oxidoreductase [Brucepastera parasyntrophica]ULQ59383.1 NAD(P)/FAD-dependent oxidoreductase [Brucepastera parasyntrophica]
MTEIRYDAAIIGAGAAGMASASTLSDRGYHPVLIDREEFTGGILLQCIHNGFGLHRYNEELTGPEFAFRLEEQIEKAGIPFLSRTTVLSIEKQESEFRLLVSSAEDGLRTIICPAVVLAMGSRERNRGNIRIPGDRPAGIYTAGLAQRLINIDGYLPGKKAVIIGSGDIGLIMARRLTLSGAEVAAVVEIQPYPSGLTRNVVQCLQDYNIPLYLSHATTRINGRERVTSVEVAPLENGTVNQEKTFSIPCDTVLLSVGLIPENELSAKTGVELNPVTNGPIVRANLMTSVPGIFAAGNVLHIHDLVDRVAEEAERAGCACADWLDSGGTAVPSGIQLKPGLNIRYTVPSQIIPEQNMRISFRSMVIIDRAVVRLEQNGRELFSKKISWVRPGEMIQLDIPPGTIPSNKMSSGNSPVTVSLYNAESEDKK